MYQAIVMIATIWLSLGLSILMGAWMSCIFIKPHYPIWWENNICAQDPLERDLIPVRIPTMDFRKTS